MEMIESVKGPLAGRAAVGEKMPAAIKSFLLNGLPVLVSLLLILLIAYQLAGLTWKMLAGEESVVEEQVGNKGMPLGLDTEGSSIEVGAIAQKVASLHLFGEASVVPKVEPTPAKARITRLDLKLYGVFVDDEPEKGAAIIGKSGGEQKYYNVGEQIDRGVKLSEVHPGHVVLSRNGRRELLKFPETSGKSFTEAPAAQIPANASLGAYREQLKKHPEKLLEQVNFVPVRDGEGNLKGYRLLPKGDRELYNRLGVRPSDLIIAVNGIALDNDQQALKVINELSSAKQINLGIIRQGQEETLAIDMN